MISAKNFIRYIIYIAAWLLITAGLLTAINKWPYATSFYAAVDSGFSIGFGSVPQPFQGAKFVVVLHVCVGAALIASVASEVVDSIIDFIPGAHEAERKRIIQLSQKGTDVDGDGRVSLYDEFIHAIYEMRLIYLEHKSFLNTFGVCIVWIAFGMGVMSTFEPTWTFLDLLYFAITAMSTGGLQGPTPNFNDCKTYPGLQPKDQQSNAPEADQICMLKTGEAVFVGIFCIVGVPLYGALVGYGSSVLIKKTIRRNMTGQILEAPDSEVQAKVAMFMDNDEKLKWSEFLILKLVQTGQVETDTCVQMKKVFDTLDKNKNGVLSKEEVQALDPKRLFAIMEGRETNEADTEQAQDP